MDTKSSLELPEWLEEPAYRNHRDTVEYCYENGWITGIITTLHTFFETWSRNELATYPGIELAETDDGYLAPHEGPDEINVSTLISRLSEERDLDSELLENSSGNPSQILDDISTIRHVSVHRASEESGDDGGYYTRPPLNSEGEFLDYDESEEFHTRPEDAISLYEDILDIPEEESITNLEIGNAETINFYPNNEDYNDFFSNPRIDAPLHAEEDESNPSGINYLNSIAFGMYHGIMDPREDESLREGYTTRYNPAQPAAAILMCNWFEQTLPTLIETVYESRNLDTRILPDEHPERENDVYLGDWVEYEVISELDILPTSAYPNALENPGERLQDLDEIARSFRHEVNSYNRIDELELRDNIWHGYEIMHLISDRTGCRTNEFDLFGEETEQQRRERPYMTRSERLTRW